MDRQTGRQKVKPTGTHNNLLWMYQIHERSKMTSIWVTLSLPPQKIEQGHCGIWELSTAVLSDHLLYQYNPLSWLSTCTVGSDNKKSDEPVFVIYWNKMNLRLHTHCTVSCVYTEPKYTYWHYKNTQIVLLCNCTSTLKTKHCHRELILLSHNWQWQHNTPQRSSVGLHTM